MFVENAPVWLASGTSNFAASYTLNLLTDLIHSVPTSGEFQGSNKKAVSLYIDNFSNNFEFHFDSGNYSEIIPAYSRGYIDITKFDTFLISSSNSGVLDIKLMTAYMIPGFSMRGNAPQLLIDKFYANVINLFHFDSDIPTSTTLTDYTIDSVSGKVFTIFGGIVSKKSFGLDGSPKFGSKCFETIEATGQAALSGTAYNGNLASSVDFYYYNNAIYSTVPNRILPLYCLYYSSSLTSYDVIYLSTDSSGVLYINVGTYSGSTHLITNHYGALFSGDYDINYHLISLYRNGNYSILYVDGAIVGAGIVTQAPSATMVPSMMGIPGSPFVGPYALIDEVRFTNAFRGASSNFDVPNVPFTNG